MKVWVCLKCMLWIVLVLQSTAATARVIQKDTVLSASFWSGLGPVGSRAKAGSLLRAILRELPEENLELLPRLDKVKDEKDLNAKQNQSLDKDLSCNVLEDPPLYHSNEQLAEYLQKFNQRCSHISHLSSFGKSVEGRTLWALEISDKPNEEEPEPYVKFVGNMHGDEPVGRVLALYLAEWLCKYYETDPEAIFIVKNVHVFLIPSLNPDGFEHRRRENVHNVDLNRDFPDQFDPRNNDLERRQPETSALMNLSLTHRFTVGASLHEGALVANYPWDGSADRSTSYSKSPDDETYSLLALTYAKGHSHMSKSQEFKEGITNGAAWYPLYGGMQDWNYIHAGCMDITIEVNDHKWPPAEQLPRLWEDHKHAMLDLVSLPAKSGLHGVVKSAVTKKPLPATVSVAGIDHKVQAGPRFGDFFRLLVPGNYSVEVSMQGYQTSSQEVVILPDSPTKLVFELEPLVVFEDGRTVPADVGMREKVLSSDGFEKEGLEEELGDFGDFDLATESQQGSRISESNLGDATSATSSLEGSSKGKETGSEGAGAVDLSGITSEVGTKDAVVKEVLAKDETQSKMQILPAALLETMQGQHAEEGDVQTWDDQKLGALAFRKRPSLGNAYLSTVPFSSRLGLPRFYEGGFIWVALVLSVGVCLVCFVRARRRRKMISYVARPRARIPQIVRRESTRL